MTTSEWSNHTQYQNYIDYLQDEFPGDTPYMLCYRKKKDEENGISTQVDDYVIDLEQVSVDVKNSIK